MKKHFTKQIILASQSPRRIELLKGIGLDFKIEPSDFEEKYDDNDASQLAVYNAIGKAKTVAEKHQNALVIGVDTVAAYLDHIIGKPKDRQDAARMISLLSGTVHEVISGVAIIDADTGKIKTHSESTRITMDTLTPEEVEAYLDTGEGADKAASYAIQGHGSLFIKKIEGDYFNVVGLPVYRLRKMLQEFGFNNFF